MNFDEFLAIGDFLVFVKKRIFRFPEFLLKYEFVRHEDLTCNDDIQKIKLTMV